MSTTQNLDLALTYSQVPGFPAGTVAAQVTATLLGSAAGATKLTQSVANGASPIEFANLAPDTYTYTVSNIDANGNVLGTVITGSFTITALATISLNLATAASPSQP